MQILSENDISLAKKYYSICKTALIWNFLILFTITPHAFAIQQDVKQPVNLFEMSLEELLEIPTVVSASRQEQKITKASVPISIITSEDIHNSGLKSIPDILQFTCGVDVRRIDRQRYAVGVRGLFGLFSDRTLILIDGRPVTDPIHGTTHWEKLPIMVEDIDRIEIVRGPGGAAWGANAYTGVINIITKKLENTLGVFSSTTITEFGDSYTHFRYGEKKDKWNWRLSVGYEDIEDSDSAGAGKYYPTMYPATGFDSYSTRDWSRLWKFDTVAEYNKSDAKSVFMQSGNFWNHTLKK